MIRHGNLHRAGDTVVFHDAVPQKRPPYQCHMSLSTSRQMNTEEPTVLRDLKSIDVNLSQIHVDLVLASCAANKRPVYYRKSKFGSKHAINAAFLSA